MNLPNWSGKVFAYYSQGAEEKRWVCMCALRNAQKWVLPQIGLPCSFQRVQIVVWEEGEQMSRWARACFVHTSLGQANNQEGEATPPWILDIQQHDHLP